MEQPREERSEGKRARARKMSPAELEARDRELAREQALPAAADLFRYLGKPPSSSDSYEDLERVTFRDERGFRKDRVPGGSSSLFLAEDAAPVFHSKNGVDWVVADLDWNHDDTDDAETDEGRWSPPATGKPVRLLNISQAAKHTGVKEHWIVERRVVPFPQPDAMVGPIKEFDGEEGWLRSTLDRWNHRPNLGRNWGPPVRFVNRYWLAEYLGLAGRSPLAGIELPPPDVLIGRREGWRPETVDEWAVKSGEWGPRLDWEGFGASGEALA
jgi:hypothetical protein